MKSNLPAKLFRIRSFGVMKLEEFKDLLSQEEYEICMQNNRVKDRWFTLTTKVFIAFLYRVSSYSMKPLVPSPTSIIAPTTIAPSSFLYLMHCKERVH